MEIENKHERNFIQSLSKYLKSLNLENGYYQFSVAILQSDEKDAKVFSYFKQCLAKSTEKMIWGNNDKK